MAGTFSCVLPGRRGFYWRHGTGSERKKAVEGHTYMVKIKQSNAVNEVDSTDLDTQFYLLQRTMIVLKRHEVRWRASKYAKYCGQISGSAYDYLLFLFTFPFGGAIAGIRCRCGG